MQDANAVPPLPTFDGPHCQVRTDRDAEVLTLASGLIGWLAKQSPEVEVPRIVVAHADVPAAEKIATTLARAIIACGGASCLLETSLAPVTSHAIIADALDAGVLVSAETDGQQCQLTLFGADGRLLDATPARQVRICTEEGVVPNATLAAQPSPSAQDEISYLEALADAMHVPMTPHVAPTVSVACVARAGHCDYVERALTLAGATAEVMAADEEEGDTDLEASLEAAVTLAFERECEVALAFDDTLDHVASAVIVDNESIRLGDDEATELALAWLLEGLDTARDAITLVSDIGSTRAIDALADHFGAALVRTLPGADAVAREVAYQRASTDPQTALVGVAADATLTLANATGTSCPVALAMALVGAAGDAHATGLDLLGMLRALDEKIGCHRTARTTVSFETPDHAPLLLMRLRDKERELICHMVVTDTIDYLKGHPIPGDPSRALPFFDAIGWTLSDGSTLILYADEAASCAHALILVRADTSAEAEAVSFFLAQEAHEILTS